jgi:hypothetical protein
MALLLLAIFSSVWDAITALSGATAVDVNFGLPTLQFAPPAGCRP